MEKTKREKVRNVLTKVFNREDSSEFYFVKSKNEFSNSIIIKTKKASSDKIRKASLLLKRETFDPHLELLVWIDTVGKLIQKKDVYKKTFFKTSEIKDFNPWRVCPIGEHWVRRHDRQKKSLEDVDGHCRKNKSNKDYLKGDELDLISRHKLFRNPKLKVLQNDLGFNRGGIDGNQYDVLINGWTAYWNDVFKTEPPLDPNYVKALMATESGFDLKSIAQNKNKKIGHARGLMQITERTQKQLAGYEKDLRDQFVVLDNEEIWDPNKNISAGIRWLFRKREITMAKFKRVPTWQEVRIDYKGKTGSSTVETKNVQKTLTEYLKKLGVD